MVFNVDIFSRPEAATRRHGHAARRIREGRRRAGASGPEKAARAPQR
jgi:hypothetical protein